MCSKIKTRHAYRLLKLSTTKNLKSEDHHGFTKNDITFKTSYLTFRHIYILIIQIKMFYLADIKSCGNFKNNKEIFFFYKDICICINIYFLPFYEDICIYNLFSVRNPKKKTLIRIDLIVYKQRDKNPDLDFKCSRSLS